MRLRPFWRYYGGKWRAAPRYPAPRYGTIIEPFAGAAGYAMRYPDRRVILVEKYPTIAEMWRYLIDVSAAEIRTIPEVAELDDLPSWVPLGGRNLVGFCLAEAAWAPRRRMSPRTQHNRARRVERPNSAQHARGWSPAMRERVASQVGSIRHWQIIEGDYTAAPRIAATWFIDPPYIGRPGSHYVHGSRTIDYAALASWCRSRDGQTIVCEAGGADWLPFRAFGETRGVSGKRSAEAIWLSDEVQQSLPLEAS